MRIKSSGCGVANQSTSGMGPYIVVWLRRGSIHTEGRSTSWVKMPMASNIGWWMKTPKWKGAKGYHPTNVARVGCHGVNHCGQWFAGTMGQWVVMIH